MSVCGGIPGLPYIFHCSLPYKFASQVKFGVYEIGMRTRVSLDFPQHAVLVLKRVFIYFIYNVTRGRLVQTNQVHFEEFFFYGFLRSYFC